MNLLNLQMKKEELLMQKYISTRPLTDAEREAISSTFAAKVGKKSLTN